MLVVCFHILAVKIYCLVVGFCDSQYFKALMLPAGHTVNFHENSSIAEIGHCVVNLDSNLEVQKTGEDCMQNLRVI